MRRVTFLVLMLTLLAAACSSDSGGGDTTTTAPATTSTTAATTTTTEATTTTTTVPATTTTAAPSGYAVATTPIVGVLQPYNEGGAELFPPGSVEAHWYQWQGRFVVVYRGWDPSAGNPMCPGNSVNLEESGFANISNSPVNGTADEVCIGSAFVVDPPDGAYVCDTLLYYNTMIPVELPGPGALWGTLELGTGEWAGQTSQAPIDVAQTPEFEIGLTAYTLPPSNVDDGGTVICG